MRDYPDWNGENPAVEALRNELKHFERMAQNLRKGLVPINPLMQKVDGSGKVVLSVYKQDMGIHLVRPLQTGQSEHLVRSSNQASADGWMLEATVVWDDLT
jgi:hypothetical protein